MTDKCELKHPYIAVQRGTHCSYGGSQNWFEKKYLRQCACGVIAGNDLILYLKEYRFGKNANRYQNLPETDAAGGRKNLMNGGGKQNQKLPEKGADRERILHEKEEADNGIIVQGQDAYMCRVKQMNRRYFPVIPGLGMTGFGLAFGLNRYFWKHHWDVRAFWGLRQDRFFDRMEEMLEQDIPVIMSIGPVFPNRWSRCRLPLYKKYGEEYREVTRINAHFITATGMDREWIRAASWGNIYYINRAEYMEYARKKSTFIFSNLVMIKRKINNL